MTVHSSTRSTVKYISWTEVDGEPVRDIQEYKGEINMNQNTVGLKGRQKAIPYSRVIEVR